MVALPKRCFQGGPEDGRVPWGRAEIRPVTRIVSTCMTTLSGFCHGQRGSAETEDECFLTASILLAHAIHVTKHNACPPYKGSLRCYRCHAGSVVLLLQLWCTSVAAER